jgi:hypothetical protein
MELEQRHMIKFLHLKGLKLQEIATELSSAYGQNAHARRNIKYWLHQIKLGRTDLQTQHVRGRPPLDDADAEILSLLRKFQFSPVRTIVDSLNIPVLTIYLHLVEQIGLKNLRVRWVPHKLTCKLRQKRTELAGQLLPVLEGQWKIDFRNVVTGDESRFLQHYGRRQI